MLNKYGLYQQKDVQKKWHRNNRILWLNEETYKVSIRS